jgi:hypothetical protein
MSRVLQTPAWLKSNAIARAIPVTQEDPRLVFMFAQQSVTGWRRDAVRLGEAADSGAEAEPVLSEATALLQRIGAQRDRIAPFANYINIAVRFEAQEILAALAQLTLEFERVVRRMRPAPWRDPEKLVRSLQARQQQAAL